MALNLFAPQKSPNQRSTRIAQQIKEVVATAFLRDEVPLTKNIENQLLTVTGVHISPDLKYATIFMSLHGNKDLLDEIQSFDWFFKKSIAKNMKLRFVPNIRFKEDTTFEKAQHIDQIIAKANNRKSN